MTQKGEHTWDLVIDYHRCPNCGFINENRQDYSFQKGIFSKQVACSRCNLSFNVQKNQKTTLGPFIGLPQPPEITWE